MNDNRLIERVIITVSCLFIIHRSWSSPYFKCIFHAGWLRAMSLWNTFNSFGQINFSCSKNIVSIIITYDISRMSSYSLRLLEVDVKIIFDVWKNFNFYQNINFLISLTFIYFNVWTPKRNPGCTLLRLADSSIISGVISGII